MYPSGRAHPIKFENIGRICAYTASDKTQRQSVQPLETSKVSDPPKRRFLRVL